MKYLKCTGILMAVLLLFAACSTPGDAITVVSREPGSGTRSAFVELTGIEQADATGKKIDRTTNTAEETNSTSVMIQSISGNNLGIGYVSLGSLNDRVKAISVDGFAPSVDNIKSGSYKVARPFNIVTGADISEAAQSFIDFILSAEGQAVVEAQGYISTGNTGAFAGASTEGKVVVAGSSSVSPVMEKLKEAYQTHNAAATIEVHTSDSTTGVNNTVEGSCDIGMVSRVVKDTEIAKGITPTVIATDGIAIIVHKENTVSSLTVEQIRDIFIGEITDWNKLTD